MAYATLSEAKSAFGDRRTLRTSAGNTEEPPQEYFERKLEAMAGIMDSYIGIIYSVPVDTSNDDRLAALLSEVNICLFLFAVTSGTAGISEGIETRHAACMKWLKMISEGTAVIPGATQDLKIWEVCGDSPPLFPTDLFDLHRVLEVIED